MIKKIYHSIVLILVTAFLGSSLQMPSYAQVDPLPFMPWPGTMVHVSPVFTPAYLKGIVIHPENPLKFDFIIYRGDKRLSEAQKRDEYTKLTKYFLASLAIPDDHQWVNLSPYEKDRIIKEDFGRTTMGRDLLAQDYLLKQITASLIDPQDSLGKKFWDKVYKEAQKQYGTTNIPVNTFNKVWILPDDALIYEKGNAAYVMKNHLRVMLQEDYLALQKRGHINVSPFGALSSQMIRSVVLPELEREVNQDQNFAPLRQVYSGMLLAAWFKRTLQQSLLGQIYANKAKIKGIDQDPQANAQIYRQYLQAYKKGVFNFIKNDVIPHQTTPRKYFSGGMVGFSSDAAMFDKRVHRTSAAAQAAAFKTGLAQADLAEVVMQEPAAVGFSRRAVMASAAGFLASLTTPGRAWGEKEPYFFGFIRDPLTANEVYDFLDRNWPVIHQTKLASSLKRFSKDGLKRIFYRDIPVLDIDNKHSRVINRGFGVIDIRDERDLKDPVVAIVFSTADHKLYIKILAQSFLISEESFGKDPSVRNAAIITRRGTFGSPGARTDAAMNSGQLMDEKIRGLNLQVGERITVEYNSLNQGSGTLQEHDKTGEFVFYVYNNGIGQLVVNIDGRKKSIYFGNFLGALDELENIARGDPQDEDTFESIKQDMEVMFGFSTESGADRYSQAVGRITPGENGEGIKALRKLAQGALKDREGNFDWPPMRKIAYPPDTAMMSGKHLDKAMPGGIDFNAAHMNLVIKRDGRGVALSLTRQDLAQLSHLKGLEPVIIAIRPASQSALLAPLP